MMNGGEGVQGARDSSKTVEKRKWFELFFGFIAVLRFGLGVL